MWCLKCVCALELLSNGYMLVFYTEQPLSFLHRCIRIYLIRGVPAPLVYTTLAICPRFEEWIIVHGSAVLCASQGPPQFWWSRTSSRLKKIACGKQENEHQFCDKWRKKTSDCPRACETERRCCNGFREFSWWTTEDPINEETNEWACEQHQQLAITWTKFESCASWNRWTSFHPASTAITHISIYLCHCANVYGLGYLNREIYSEMRWHLQIIIILFELRGTAGERVCDHLHLSSQMFGHFNECGYSIIFQVILAANARMWEFGFFFFFFLGRTSKLTLFTCFIVSSGKVNLRLCRLENEWPINCDDVSSTKWDNLSLVE